MREPGPTGPNSDIYWLGHGTVLLSDGRLWTRVHNIPRRKLYVPTLSENVPVHLFKPERTTDIRREPPHPEHLRIRDEWKVPQGNRGLHYVWTGTTTFVVDADRISEPYEPGTPMDSEQDDNGEEPEEPVDYLPDEAPMGPPPPPPTTTTSSSAKPSSSPHVHPATTAPADAELPEQSPTTQSVMEPEPLEEPQVPPSLTTSHLPIPEGQKPFFVPENKETFAQQRARVARQETLLIRRPESYGPATAQPVRETPYSQKPLNDDDKIEFTCEVDLMPNSHLPPGWNYENGYMVLGEIEDEWRIEGNYLTSGPGEGVHSNRGQLSCSFEVFGTPTHHQVGQWTSSPRQMDPWYALQTADRTRLDWLHTVQDPNTTPKGCQEHLPGQELWR